jgi:hypothetical protein
MLENAGRLLGCYLPKVVKLVPLPCLIELGNGIASGAPISWSKHRLSRKRIKSGTLAQSEEDLMDVTEEEFYNGEDFEDAGEEG